MHDRDARGPACLSSRRHQALRPSQPVLENIDLTVRKGEFVSIIGPSGCGKSTILKLVSGLTPVTSGTLLVDGMTPANAREIVSFIFQDPTLLPWRTVEKNMPFARTRSFSAAIAARKESMRCSIWSALAMSLNPTRGSSRGA